MWEEARRKQEEEARKIREKEEEARKMLERLEQARKARKQEEQERKMLEQQKQKQARRRGRRGTAVPNPVLDPKEMDAEAREARRQRLEKLRAKAGTRRGGG
jgi:colicin import membrane protein